MVKDMLTGRASSETEKVVVVKRMRQVQQLVAVLQDHAVIYSYLAAACRGHISHLLS